MKKTLFLSIISIVVLGSLSFKVIHGSGESGATGSFGEGDCSGCHGGGPGVTTVSISSIPAFTNNAFDPLTTYTINVTVANPSLSVYGFDCEILGSNNASIGTMTLPSTGVKLVTAFNGRRNATHSAKQSGSGSFTFSFQWISPALGNATFYAAGNAVNNNNSTSGDNPSTTVLTVTNVNTGMKNNETNPMSGVNIFPNPASDMITISYMIDHSMNVVVELTDISGKKVKTLLNSEQNAGPHSHFFDLKGTASGIYFIKINSGEKLLSQKLVSLN